MIIATVSVGQCASAKQMQLLFVECKHCKSRVYR